MQSLGATSAPWESRPLLRSVSESSVSNLWLVAIGSILVGAWCVLDSWNHDMSSELFQMSEVKHFDVDHHSGTLSGELQPFKYTLTLAFLQFAFAGFVFCSIFLAKVAAKSNSQDQSITHLRSTMTDGRWPALVGTHVFGSLLLQSLMMPTHMMSLGFFAATRAVEVPVAAGVRSKVLGPRFSGPSARTTLLMAAAAWLLFYSYTQIAECLCVWSGFGVALTGIPLYFVYALLLTIPATNTVLQESVLVQLEVDPMLMLGIQNACAAMLFSPMLIAAHYFGYEDVYHGVAMITSHREICMTVLWLCVQTAVISAVTVGLILTMDSFWTVAARSLRVIFWWSRQLVSFYLTSSTLLSIAYPHASLWSFMMLCGIVLACSALLTDSRKIADKLEDEHLVGSPESALMSKTTSIGKYV